jgi:O-antigen/teichoic acid export membrane protein
MSYLLESVLTALLLLNTISTKKIDNFKFSKRKIKFYLKRSLPLLISGGLILVYMKVDQIMIGSISGMNEVAIYTNATRLSEAWYFIGIIIIGIVFPKAIKSKVNGKKAFELILAKLTSKLLLFTLVLIISTIILSDDIINLFYGENYSRSSVVLVITICCVPFVYLGNLSTRLYVNNGENRMILIRSIISLLLNLLLNVILIPGYGSVGAALATLISQITSGLIFNYFSSANFRNVLNMSLKPWLTYAK